MNLINLFKKAIHTVVPGTLNATYSDIIEQAYREFKTNGANFWSLNPGTTKAYTERLLSLSDKEKLGFILEVVELISLYHSKRTNNNYQEVEHHHHSIREAFMKQLLRSKLQLDDNDLIALIKSFLTHKGYGNDPLQWPLASLLTQVEKFYKQQSGSNELLEGLKRLKLQLDENKMSYGVKERSKIIDRINSIIFGLEQPGAHVEPVWFKGEDAFTDYANECIKNMAPENQNNWFRILSHCGKVSGATPNKKFLEESCRLYEALGRSAFLEVVNDWFQFITHIKEPNVSSATLTNPFPHPANTDLLAPPNIEKVKGLVWICAGIAENKTLNTLSALAERAFRKVPGKGPAAAALGNACIFSLAQNPGFEGVGHLSRLRIRIKHNSTQNLIEKYLNQAAERQGVSLHEIEDMSVEDYGLSNSTRIWNIENFKAELKIKGVGKTDLSWYKADGSPQKSIPSLVKDKYAGLLKEIKETAKQIEITTTANRDRLDRMFKLERKWTWNQFMNHYFHHGLMTFLVQKMVWTFDNGKQTFSAIYHNGSWVNPSGNIPFSPLEGTMVSLWHPVKQSIEEVSSWRSFLLDQAITQPTKQVFREVYILTDAEINTRTYSNRMAAHLLKQHQFNSLAKSRAWKYTLLGAYDNGFNNQMASVLLPEYKLRAEFWINEVNADDAFSESGIWLYVSTDQVRFMNTETETVVELIEVPAILFSEVMRDVDLFVGVASVGNDPVWRDSGGLVQYRDYWQSFSFGDLSEVAKTRKILLERLLPRMKIAKVAEIIDKFLVVKGKLRTYKIHIGSTNILMEPNDQYLCIVPDRSAKNSTENLFLPFDGDNGVSVILSKALLLADDDKITDITITSQIQSK